MDYQTTGQDSQNAGKYTAIGIVVIIALALWYFYAKRAPVDGIQNQSAEQAQLPAPSSGNTTADISSDLNQIPDTSADLDAAAAAAAKDIQSL